MNHQNFNTDRELSTFDEPLAIIRKHGFKPIAVAQMYFEDTFVFETEEESVEAFEKLENIEESEVQGWWYGREEFLKYVEEYEREDDGSKVLIYWL